jgi:HEAT repeat protein
MFSGKTSVGSIPHEVLAKPAVVQADTIMFSGAPKTPSDADRRLAAQIQHHMKLAEEEPYDAFGHEMMVGELQKLESDDLKEPLIRQGLIHSNFRIRDYAVHAITTLKSEARKASLFLLAMDSSDPNVLQRAAGGWGIHSLDLQAILIEKALESNKPELWGCTNGLYFLKSGKTKSRLIRQFLSEEKWKQVTEVQDSVIHGKGFALQRWRDTAGYAVNAIKTLETDPEKAPLIEMGLKHLNVSIHESAARMIGYVEDKVLRAGLIDLAIKDFDPNVREAAFNAAWGMHSDTLKKDWIKKGLVDTNPEICKLAARMIESVFSETIRGELLELMIRKPS